MPQQRTYSLNMAEKVSFFINVCDKSGWFVSSQPHNAAQQVSSSMTAITSRILLGDSSHTPFFFVRDNLLTEFGSIDTLP